MERRPCDSAHDVRCTEVVFYTKILLIFVWLVISSVLCNIYAILRWGNLDIDRHFGRLFSWGALKIADIQLKIEGWEYLEAHQPCIYVANHQSALDLATLGAIYPRRTILIGKKELLWVPFFGVFYVAAGNILIDRQRTVKAVAGLSEAVEAIRKKSASIWIFPEGTRNKAGQGLLPFKRGAFHMALQAGVPVIPIICSPISELASWKEKRLGGGSLRIRILPPVDTEHFEEKEVEKLTREVKDRMLEALRGLEA